MIYEMNKKKRILFVNGHLNVGGVEKSLTDILQHMDYKQYEVDLLLLEEIGDYGTELPKEVNMHLRSLKNTYGSFGTCVLKCIRQKDWFSLKMRIVFLLMRLFGQKRIHLAEGLLTEGRHYDIAVGFRPGICTQIVSFAVKADRKIAWWHHGEFNVRVEEYQKQIENCDILVSVSESCARMLTDKMPGISGKITVISNMIDTKRLEGKSRACSPYKDNITHIATVCRLSPEKHLENVIFAAAQLKEEGYIFQWHIIGDGAERGKLEKLQEDKGVQDCVILEGAKENPYPYIKNADLYVHPSYVESQGITILEAMALKVPCVVTKSRGPCEFIVDGENGILTDQNWNSLETEVKQMLVDNRLYRDIQMRTICPPQFEPEQVMEKIYRVFG